MRRRHEWGASHCSMAAVQVQCGMPATLRSSPAAAAPPLQGGCAQLGLCPCRPAHQPCFCLLACSGAKCVSVRFNASLIDTYSSGQGGQQYMGGVSSRCSCAAASPQSPMPLANASGTAATPVANPLPQTHMRHVAKVAVGSGAGEGAVGGRQLDARGREVALQLPAKEVHQRGDDVLHQQGNEVDEPEGQAAQGGGWVTKGLRQGQLKRAMKAVRQRG